MHAHDKCDIGGSHCCILKSIWKLIIHSRIPKIYFTVGIHTYTRAHRWKKERNNCKARKRTMSVFAFLQNNRFHFQNNCSGCIPIRSTATIASQARKWKPNERAGRLLDIIPITQKVRWVRTSGIYTSTYYWELGKRWKDLSSV